jgi:hypothetical protein
MTPRSRYLPTPDQHLLLEALIRPDDEAAIAARAWLDRIVFDDVDLGTRRLLPLFHLRMRELSIDHALDGRIRGIYRRAWYVDQRHGRMLALLLPKLVAGGVPVILLKGAGLGLTVYPNTTLRPYDDVDLLVPHARIEAARDILLADGFALHGDFAHSIGLRKADHLDIDLHHSPYRDAVNRDHAAPLWTRARPIGHAMDGVSVLGPEDQLHHTLRHGLRRNAVSPVRWVVDAVHQLRAAGDAFDWDLLVAETMRLDMVESSLRGLAYLQSLDERIVDRRALARLTAARGLGSRFHFHLENNQGPFANWAATRRNTRGFDRVRLLLDRYSRQWGITAPLPFIRHAVVRGFDWLIWRRLKRRRSA